jgi:hypothetical protein
LQSAQRWPGPCARTGPVVESLTSGPRGDSIRRVAGSSRFARRRTWRRGRTETAGRRSCSRLAGSSRAPSRPRSPPSTEPHGRERGSIGSRLTHGRWPPYFRLRGPEGLADSWILVTREPERKRRGCAKAVVRARTGGRRGGARHVRHAGGSRGRHAGQRRQPRDAVLAEQAERAGSGDRRSPPERRRRGGE